MRRVTKRFSCIIGNRGRESQGEKCGFRGSGPFSRRNTVPDRESNDMRRRFLTVPALAAVLVSLTSPDAQAATLRVGTGQTYTVPSQAAAVAQDGDTVEIAAETYTGDVAVWRANRLTLRGVGGTVVLDAEGHAAEGKGLWVIKGDDTTVEDITFTGAAVPDHNGAGIRQEGRGLTVRHCTFRDNEDGILAGDSPQSDILVEACEFDHNGQGDGYSHNMYINHVRRFTLRGCWSHNAHRGHDVKSRALATDILYNRISDDDASDTSYLIDLPNGGLCRIIGNILRRGLNAQNAVLLSYAEEGASNPRQSLSVIANTFVTDRPTSTFLRTAGHPTLRVLDNLFLGPGTPPGGSAGDISHNRTAPPADFRDAAHGDYHLAAHSPARAAGIPPGLDSDGQDLTPRSEYAAPTGLAPRPTSPTPDLGAYGRVAP
jgi:hypothetical protein